MKQIKQKLLWCIVGNFMSLFIIIIAILSLENKGSYWRFGPNDTLIVISIQINTWTKYICFILLLGIINTIKVFSEEIGMPILGFNIYNPDKKIITEFSKNELQLMANSMYLINALRSTFITIVTITQMDIALWNVAISELCSFFTIRMILNEKMFQSHELNEPFIEIVGIESTS